MKPILWRGVAVLEIIRTGALLSRDRIKAWTAVLLILEILATTFLVAGTHGWITPLDRPTSTDFASFYTAGTLAREGRPAQAYDQASLYAMQQRLTEPGVEEQRFFYPPVYLMLCVVLARMPYFYAFAAFELTSAAAFFLAIRAILDARGYLWALVLTAFPATLWAVGIGQNSFISAALFGFGTLWLRKYPMVAGLILGCLCFKPHLGLLIPVALLAGREWRAVIGAMTSVAVLVLASGWQFGWPVWQAFLVAFSRAGSAFEVGQVPYSGLVSLYAASRILGLSVTVSYGVQALSAVLAAGAVAFVWRYGTRYSIKAAALIAGTLLSIPVVLFYDLLLAAVAAAWLIKEGRSKGFESYEIATLVMGFLVPLACRPLAEAIQVPIGPLLPASLLAFCVIPAWRESRARKSKTVPISF